MEEDRPSAGFENLGFEGIEHAPESADRIGTKEKVFGGVLGTVAFAVVIASSAIAIWAAANLLPWVIGALIAAYSS
ncbi:hypothetical protein J4H92_13220 [Leucobacter weissii]|uniref:Uncharacterized protein n=1 Tax=Leucobacter weissii TaxID=1983706 RepID=A0A939S993_9MICO|nr:hypothetical protein [Leucobacter weissii]MBO1902906.1 hypothetical protein [Leucobacter weissii]